MENEAFPDAIVINRWEILIDPGLYDRTCLGSIFAREHSPMS